MTPEQIKELIDQLLKTGEILATEAYRLAVQQVYAEIAMNSIIAAVLLIFATLSIFLARKGWREHWRDGDTNSATFFGGGLAATLLSLFSLRIITDTVGMAMNPGWYAIQKLVNLF